MKTLLIFIILFNKIIIKSKVYVMMDDIYIFKI